MSFIHLKVLGVAFVILMSVCLLTSIVSAVAGNTTGAPLLASSNFSQQARLVSGKAADNYANTGVGISGDTAVVASDEGVHVYVRSGGTWSEQAVLVPGDGLSGFASPKSIAIEGDTVVIGCRQSLVNGINTGAAYVFVRNGTIWAQQQRLTSNDALANDNFGHSVSISGNTIVVSANTHQINGNLEQGAVYAFIRNGTTWTEQARILAEDGAARNGFGLQTSIDGDTLAVSRPRNTFATIVDPAVYIFVRNGPTWQQQQRLSVCEPSGNNLCAFGISVAVEADTLAVGNWFLNVGSNTAQGGVYTFSRSGTVWLQQQKLTAADGLKDDLFGSAVGINGETLVVGAEADIGVPGKAYVYSWSGTEWSFQQKLAPGANRNDFGQKLSMDPKSLIIAAPLDDGSPGSFIGAAYIYINNNATPTPTPTPTATPTPTPTPTPSPTPTPPTGPTIFIEEGTTALAAVDSVTLVRGPFTLTDDHNLSSDHRTRIIFFTTNLGFTQPTQTDIATLSVEVDGFSLSVESVGPSSLNGFDASYIVFRLPDLPVGEWPLMIRLRGVPSTNSPTISVRAGP